MTQRILIQTLGWIGALAGSIGTGVSAEPNQVCTYDPSLGQPNPRGMRAMITITEEAGNTTFLYEQFPFAVGDGLVGYEDPEGFGLLNALITCVEPGG